MSEPRLMTTDEVAVLCRTAPSTVRWWRHMSQGPVSMKVGKRVLYERRDVEQWLHALRTTS